MPAFSGLYAPYWKADARGVIAGLTRYVNKGHIDAAAVPAHLEPGLEAPLATRRTQVFAHAPLALDRHTVTMVTSEPLRNVITAHMRPVSTR